MNKVLMFLVTCVVMPLSLAQAATQVVADGKLLGATGVNVDGVLYDVSFLDGTCNSLFSGCTSFTFTTLVGARHASQALLDSVFLDTGLGPFDAQPELTAGCVSNICTVYTPYETFETLPPVTPALLFNAALATNFDTSGVNGVDSVRNDFARPTSDFTRDTGKTFAVWTLSQVTAVPEPETYAMLLAGLGLMGFMARRRKQAA